MNKSIRELASLVSELPGIGPRQARRIVQFLLGKSGAYREKLAKSIVDVGARVSQCNVCFRYDGSDASGVCEVCRDGERDLTLLMVVEKDADADAIESSGSYKGQYFILGGLIPMTERKNAPKARVKELEERLKKNGITEVILALSTTPEGDYTTQELMRTLTSHSPKTKTSLLGRGLSIGAEIEYADAETIRNAFRNRTNG